MASTVASGSPEQYASRVAVELCASTKTPDDITGPVSLVLPPGADTNTSTALRSTIALNDVLFVVVVAPVSTESIVFFVSAALLLSGGNGVGGGVIWGSEMLKQYPLSVDGTEASRWF